MSQALIAVALVWVAVSGTATVLTRDPLRQAFTAGFFGLALAFLFTAGFLELFFNAMAQSLVQLNAPLDMRGRVIGLFNMASLGLRAFSGISVGLLGSAIGIHWSLGLSALAAMAVAGVLLAVQ